MYYSEIFFRKSTYEIEEKDIIDFFTQNQEETSVLEFKSGDVALEKIYKEVAALHNSQGGLIIIGSPRPTKEKNGKETFYGSLTKSIHRHKDWLYQKISSNISPAPTELRIHDILIENGIVQVIDIPKSNNPPHQCLNDGIYYLRFETETRYAPHGLVESFFNKRQEPTVDCFIQSKIITKQDKEQIQVTLKIINKSKLPLIGLHYIINVDNVYKAEAFDETVEGWYPLRTIVSNEGVKIRYSRSVDKNNIVLVEGVSYESDYLLSNLKEPLLISILIWSSNMNLKKFYFIISPNDNKYYKLPIHDDSNYEVNFAINNIVSNAKSRNENIDEKGFLKLIAKLYENKVKP